MPPPKFKVGRKLREICLQDGKFGYYDRLAVCNCSTCQGNSVPTSTMKLHCRRQNALHRINKLYYDYVKITASREVFIPLNNAQEAEFLASGEAHRCTRENSNTSHDAENNPVDPNRVWGNDLHPSMGISPVHDNCDSAFQLAPSPGEPVNTPSLPVAANADLPVEPSPTPGQNSVLTFWKTGAPQCVNLQPGQYLCDRIDNWIESNATKTAINQELDSLHRNTVGMLDSKEFNKCVRAIQQKYKTVFTCENHHGTHPPNLRKRKCGFTVDGKKCSKKIKVGVRSVIIRETITRRLRDPNFCRQLEWGPNFRETKQNQISSIWTAGYISELREKHPDLFQGDHMPILCGLFVDGFNPYYYVNDTLCSAVLVFFNLPPEIRMKPENLELLLLVDGPKEPVNFQDYFKDIIDEFEELEQTFSAFDAASQSMKKYKASLILTVQDGRGITKTSMMAEAGHDNACCKCTCIGKYCNGKKHYTSRGNLPEGHHMRNDGAFGPQMDYTWENKTHQFIKTRAEAVSESRPNLDEGWLCGIKGRSHVLNLPYFDAGKCHLVCLMHTFHNIGKRFENLAIGCYDSVEARQLMKEEGIKEHLWIDEAAVNEYRDLKRQRNELRKCKDKDGQEKELLEYKKKIKKAKKRMPKGDWVFASKSSENTGNLNEENALEFLRKMEVPCSTTVLPSSFFQGSKYHNNVKSKGKAAGYMQFMLSGLFSAALLAGGVSDSVCQAFDDLFDCMRRLINPVVKTEEFERLSQDILECVCVIEKEIPRSEAVLSLHQIIHLPQQCLWFGPARDTWAFPLESYLGHLKARARNRAHTGASIFNRHVYEQALREIKQAIQQNDAGQEIQTEFDNKGFKLIGNPKYKCLEWEEVDQIKQYISENWKEYKSLENDLRDKGYTQSPWEAVETMSIDAKNEFSGIKRHILDGVDRRAFQYGSFSIGRTRFGIRDGTRRNDIAVLGKKTPKSVAIIKSILLVSIGGFQDTFIKVEKYHSIEYHEKLRRLLVATKKKRKRFASCWIQEHQIQDQGYIGPDLTVPNSKRESRYLIPRKGYIREIN